MEWPDTLDAVAWEDGKNGEWEGHLKSMAEEHREDFEAMVGLVLDKVKKGQLRPVLLSRQAFTKYWEGAGRRSLEEGQAQLRALHKAGKAKMGKRAVAETVALLELLKEASPPDAEVNRLLHGLLFTGEDLYKAGIPSIKAWMDEYQPGLWDSEVMGEGVAIIQKPAAFQLDEKGFFKPPHPYRTDNLKKALGQLEELLPGVRAQIKLFLAAKAVVDMVSEYAGVDLAEDFSGWLRDIEQAARWYTAMFGENGLVVRFSSRKSTRAPNIEISSLQPDPAMVEHLKERLRPALGHEWLEFAARKMREWAEEGSSHEHEEA
jgi:hypothetical protein